MNIQCRGNNGTAELGALQHLGAIGGIHNSGNAPTGGVVAQKEIHQQDRRAALLAAYDNMTDEAQCAAVGMLQSIARGSPRRPAPLLQLVAGGNNGLHLVTAPRRI